LNIENEKGEKDGKRIRIKISFSRMKGIRR
jgi:hypothetical protein